jgi:CheY-like chemotaxis protein
MVVDSARVAVVRLLAVDDDPAILTVIRRIAADLHYEIECLSNSQHFMTTFVRMKPDIVSLDIFMPDVDGIELIRWLDDIDSKVSVVVVSGGNPMLARAGKKLADAKGSLRTTIVHKPFDVADLRKAFELAALGPAPARAPG